jgi:hypothetical protein
MTETPKIITQSHNETLREAFQAFTAEGLPLPIAAIMVEAHVQHLQTLVMDRLVTCLARIEGHLGAIAGLTDPVRASAFTALLRAQDGKREESKEGRTKEDAMAALTALTGSKISLGDGFPVRNLTPETVTRDRHR